MTKPERTGSNRISNLHNASRVLVKTLAKRRRAPTRANAAEEKHPRSATCDHGTCGTRVWFSIPFTRHETGPGARTRLAIRCAFCFQVFCLRHATQHFGACREGKLADMLAKRVTTILAKAKPQPGAMDKLADLIAKRLAVRIRSGRARRRR
jgi:hypothetical protein